MFTVTSAPIGYISKISTVVITVWVFTTTIRYHTYMDFEKPGAFPNLYLGSSDYKAAYKANTTAPYCVKGNYDYDFGGGWLYKPDGCRDTAGAYSELFKKEASGVRLTTFYQESQLLHSGAYASEPTLSYFFPHVEELMVYLPNVLTVNAMGMKRANLPCVFKGSDGNGPVKHFAEGEIPAVKLKDLLTMAGLALDDENTGSGGLGVAEGSGNKYWPRYRMTGVNIILNMKYSNTNQKRVFDFSPHLEVTVTHASKENWASIGPRIMTLPQNDGRWKLVERYEYGINLSYQVMGGIGRMDTFSLIYSFLIIIAGFVLTFLVAEFLSGLWVKNYYDMKTFSENNWAMICKLTFDGFRSGQLQKSAMALGFKPVGPTANELAVGGLSEDQNTSPRSPSGGKRVIYIGDS